MFIAPPKILGPPLNLAPPPPNLIFCTGRPQLFWSEIFRSPLTLGGAATMGYSMFSGQELEVDLGIFNFCLVRAKKCL